MKYLRMITLGGLVLVSSTPRLEAGQFAQIVAFGDSLTDTGNVYALSGGMLPASPPYFNGRFSDGPVWVERLAVGLGVPDLAPSALGGTNYAFGGAETALGGLSTRGTPNIGMQITGYLNSHPTITSGQLFVVWGGANDFLHFPQLPLPDPSLPVANLVAEITALAQAGAKNFLVPNLPLLGETPDVMQLAQTYPGIVATMNNLTAQFNSDLAAAELGLQASLGIKIFPLDVAGLFQQVLSNPGSYGLTDVIDQAKAGSEGTVGTVVSNPDQYLFFDQVHPTQTFHLLLGNAALAAVPEPASIILLGLGLFGGLAYAGRCPSQ